MRATGRRGFDVCAALVTVSVLTVTSTACQKRVEPIESKSTVPALSSTSLNFAGVPDGDAPLDFGPGVATISPDFIFDDPGAKFRIVDGKLTVEPTQARQTASYYSTPDLGSPVTKIGARWTYNPRGGTKDAAMGLLVSNKIVRPPFPIHLAITPYKWAYGVWPPMDGEKVPELDNLAEGEFDPPLKEDGTTVYEAEVTLDGDRALISLPDGQRPTVRDKRIAEWAGNFATFEAWAKNGVTDSAVAFTEIWAGRRPIG
jgi:hypothetical protein